MPLKLSLREMQYRPSLLIPVPPSPRFLPMVTVLGPAFYLNLRPPGSFFFCPVSFSSFLHSFCIPFGAINSSGYVMLLATPCALPFFICNLSPIDVFSFNHLSQGGSADCPHSTLTCLVSVDFSSSRRSGPFLPSLFPPLFSDYKRLLPRTPPYAVSKRQVSFPRTTRALGSSLYPPLIGRLFGFAVLPWTFLTPSSPEPNTPFTCLL